MEKARERRHRDRRDERRARDPLGLSARLDVNRAHAPVDPLQRARRRRGQDAPAGAANLRRQPLREHPEAAAGIVEERRVDVLGALLELQQTQHQLGGAGGRDAGAGEVHRELARVAPHLPGQRLEHQLVHPAPEALEDVLLVGGGIAPADQAAEQRGRVTEPEAGGPDRPQQGQQVAEAQRVVQVAPEQPDAVPLLVLDQVVAKQAADLVEDPRHDRVELVRAVIEGEAVALEAAAQTAQRGRLLHHRHRPAVLGEVTSDGEARDTAAEDDDGLTGRGGLVQALPRLHCFLATTSVWPIQYRRGMRSRPTKRTLPVARPPRGPRYGAARCAT